MLSTCLSNFSHLLKKLPRLKKGLLETHLKYLLFLFTQASLDMCNRLMVTERVNMVQIITFTNLQISEDKNQMIRVMTTGMDDTTKKQLFQDKQQAELPITITNLRV